LYLYFIMMSTMDSMKTAIETAVSSTSSRDSGYRLNSKKSGYHMPGAYFVFMLCTAAVWRLFSDGDFSAIYTIGVGVQCLGFYLLFAKVQKERSVAGISAKTLQLYVLVFVFRLTSTCMRDGYLPLDRTGDWVFQAADGVSLVMALVVLRRVLVVNRDSYQEEYDTMPLLKMIPPCITLAVALHGDLNNHFYLDTVWTISMNLDTIAMLPQLWMLTKIGGVVEGLTSHFVAALAFSRACAFAFWFYGYAEIGPQDDETHVNFAGYQLITCHALQVLMSLDFLYYYLKARMKGERMLLPTIEV
jgi:hypothetical protein